jgi:hypothetical protein
MHWPTPPRERRGGTCPPARPGGSSFRKKTQPPRCEKFASRRFVFSGNASALVNAALSAVHPATSFSLS